MADLTQTATAVHPHKDATTITVQAGEGSIVPGEPLYKKASDSKYYKAVNSGAAEAAASVIAVGYAPSANDYVSVLSSGDIDLGATLTVGERYFVSNTAGKIAPSADIGAGEWSTEVGRAEAADKLTTTFSKVTTAAHG